MEETKHTDTSEHRSSGVYVGEWAVRTHLLLKSPKSALSLLCTGGKHIFKPLIALIMNSTLSTLIMQPARERRTALRQSKDGANALLAGQPMKPVDCLQCISFQHRGLLYYKLTLTCSVADQMGDHDFPSFKPAGHLPRAALLPRLPHCGCTLLCSLCRPPAGLKKALVDLTASLWGWRYSPQPE